MSKFQAVLILVTFAIMAVIAIGSVINLLTVLIVIALFCGCAAIMYIITEAIITLAEW